MREINYSDTKNKTLGNKNYCAIDIAKFVAAIFVMFIHYSSLFSNKWTELFFVNVLCRYAVPFFFISTGFFLLKKIKFKNGKMEKSVENYKIFLKYEIRIVILYMIWSIIYGALRLYEYFASNVDYSFLKDYIVSLFFVGSYYHLWYLLSVIIALPVIYLILSFVKVKCAIVGAVILYILGTVAYAYYWLPNITIYVELCDTSQILGIALSRALPLIIISLILINYKPLSKKLSIGLLVICISLNIVEVLLLNLFTENTSNYSYIVTTLPLSICVFSVLSNINITINKKACSYMRKFSTIIYCVHPLVYYFVNMLTFPTLWMNFGLSLIICLAFSFLLTWLSDLKYGKFLKYLY